MVESKCKRWLYFFAFIIPCFVLYIVFFIAPFFKGIGISFTNWDGLEPKTPISMPKKEFEEKILDNLSEKDRHYINEVYSFNGAYKIQKEVFENDILGKMSKADREAVEYLASKEGDFYIVDQKKYENMFLDLLSPEDRKHAENVSILFGDYSRKSVSGKERAKLEFVVNMKAGYEPAKYKFVGFDNYKKIFTGKISDDFYPKMSTVHKYESLAYLKTQIPSDVFEKEIINGRGSSEDIAIVRDAYVYNDKNKQYELKEDFVQANVEKIIYDISALKSSDEEKEAFIFSIVKLTLNDDYEGAKNEALAFIEKNQINESAHVNKIFDFVEKMKCISSVKKSLERCWVISEFRMGVVGFTLFFAFFSVIGINLLAFALAIALDSGIRGQKILRTIFFLPNVLSMVIVALIWSMLFTQLLPAITGINEWVSDSAKTPWLLVLVAVWQGAGYYMIVYLAGLQNIPTDVIEAAKIDGATGIQRFRYITLPLMIPALTISLFLTIANALKSFDLIYALIGQTGYQTGTVPFVMDIYFDAYSRKFAGLATAKAMVLFFAIVVVTGVQLWTMKRKEVEA